MQQPAPPMPRPPSWARAVDSERGGEREQSHGGGRGRAREGGTERRVLTILYCSFARISSTRSSPCSPRPPSPPFSATRLRSRLASSPSTSALARASLARASRVRAPAAARAGPAKAPRRPSAPPGRGAAMATRHWDLRRPPAGSIPPGRAAARVPATDRSVAAWMRL